MIDHLIRFQDEYDLDAFQITLPEDAEIGATATCVLIGELPATIVAVSVINNEAEFDPLSGDLLSPSEKATGKWMVVRAQEEMPAWRSDPRLITIADDNLAAANEPFVIWKNAAFPWEAMQGRVSPTFTGSHYPFGPHMNESQMVSGP